MRAAVLGSGIGSRWRGLNGLLKGGFNIRFNGGFEFSGKAGGAGKGTAQANV